MKISNKVRITNYNLFIILCVVIILLSYIFRDLLDVFFDSAVLNFLFIVSAIIVFGLIAIMLFTQMIFELDGSGEIISIRSYRSFQISKRMGSPFFEIPKRQIVNMKIQHVFFKKYLALYFKNSSGKLLKIMFDITGCSRKDLQCLSMFISQCLREQRSKNLDKNI